MTLLATSAAILLLLFAGGWAVARKIDNYSLVDALWAFAIGLTALSWLVMGRGDVATRAVAAALVTAWSLRLGLHLHRRIQRMHPEEDARYVKLRTAWRGREAAMFFVFFEIQAVSVLILALPFLFIAEDRSPWSAWESVGLGIALVGIAGESMADRQMSAFKRTNPHASAVCRDGLWRFSRHPNYFFESVIWLGFYVFACGSHHGWATIHAPAIILFLLLKVTGIPPTEAAAIARKGEAYRDYQRSTSAFIPMPPRKHATS